MLAITNHTFSLEAEDELAMLGHRTLRLPPHPNLPSPVSSHPDMLLFFTPDAIFCTRSYYQIANEELKEISRVYGAPFQLIDAEYQNEYPLDVPLNALLLGKNLFCNTKTVARELLELGLTPCHVNQGYAKCSTLPLGESAMITSDVSIAKKATDMGLDVLQIEAGHISLDGYDYGFIGGCASFAPRKNINTVFFHGDITNHPDYNRIYNFCVLHNYSVKGLSNIGLCDIGTIFMI